MEKKAMKIVHIMKPTADEFEEALSHALKVLDGDAIDVKYAVTPAFYSALILYS